MNIGQLVKIWVHPQDGNESGQLARVEDIDPAGRPCLFKTRAGLLSAEDVVFWIEVPALHEREWDQRQR
jgi:hypothetical protein